MCACLCISEKICSDIHIYIYVQYVYIYIYIITISTVQRRKFELPPGPSSQMPDQSDSKPWANAPALHQRDASDMEFTLRSLQNGYHLTIHLVITHIYIYIIYIYISYNIYIYIYHIYIWVCLKMLCTPEPNGFADHGPYIYPYEKWLFHWEY